jgi:hypothetical protein
MDNQPQEDPKQQLIERLKSANNILVTVSRDPSVDQLAACIGLALLLNKQGKHTAAVFSGQVPSTLEFLQPEETLEKTTDSLRDFIISLDKSKADKLRYKVEDDVVRIFITPYRTSITQDDLDFSQGDFNVDVVVALGVARQEDLDEAITTHGRILHDATVASVNNKNEGGLGSINWQDNQASSLSELVAELAQALDPGRLDAQIATALMTGIVAETDRFSNDKTSSQTMSISAALMAAGANQQLVASKLEEAGQPQLETGEGEAEEGDGTIRINHADEQADAPPENFELPAPTETELPSEQIEEPIPAEPEPAPPAEPAPETPPPEDTPGSRLITEPPTLGGTLTASNTDDKLDPVTDPLSLPASEQPQLLERKPLPQVNPLEPPIASVPPPQPVSGEPPADTPNQTLADLEAEVKKDEAVVPAPATTPAVEPPSHLSDAREEVSRALADSSDQAPAQPIQALNAQPLGDDLHPAQPIGPAQGQPPAPSLEEQIPGLSVPSEDVRNQPVESADTAPPKDPNAPPAPPPVPPPLPPSAYNTSNQQQQ